MARFRRMKTLQKFSSVHASVYNHFSQERRLVSRQIYKERRSATLAEWRAVMALRLVGFGPPAPKWRRVRIGQTAPRRKMTLPSRGGEPAAIPSGYERPISGL